MPSRKRKKKSGAQAGRPEAAANQAAASTDAAAAARREEQRREWAQRKRAKEREPLPVALFAWLGGGGIAIAAVIAVVVLVMSGGGSDDSGPVVTATPDPRVAGLPVDQTEEVIADDQGQNINPTYSKTTIVGKAGDVIEIRMPNQGTVAHNLVVAGEDGEYGTDDDWITDPGTVEPGETGVVKVKIDKAGTYQFHCEFHPQQQVGNLVLS